MSFDISPKRFSNWVTAWRRASIRATLKQSRLMFSHHSVLTSVYFITVFDTIALYYQMYELNVQYNWNGRGILVKGWNIFSFYMV